MYAMILAAGRGERMLPLTSVTPKPLLRVGEKTLIEHQIDRLSEAGIEKFVVNCGRFGEKIVDHIQKNCDQNHKFCFSMEGENILDTGGGVMKALPLIHSDPFIVVNADVWSDYDYKKLLDKPELLAHLVLVENPEHHPEGDFGIDKHNKINVLEKKYTFSGIAAYRKSCFENRQIKSFPLLEVFQDLGSKGQITAEIHHGFWSDIGTPERLKSLQQSLII